MFGFFDFLIIICGAGIITDFIIKKQKIQAEMLKDQIELEKVKHQNYLIETEKLKIELERLQLEDKTHK